MFLRGLFMVLYHRHRVMLESIIKSQLRLSHESEHNQECWSWWGGGESMFCRDLLLIIWNKSELTQFYNSGSVVCNLYLVLIQNIFVSFSVHVPLLILKKLARTSSHHQEKHLPGKWNWDNLYIVVGAGVILAICDTYRRTLGQESLRPHIVSDRVTIVTQIPT